MNLNREVATRVSRVCTAVLMFVGWMVGCSNSGKEAAIPPTEPPQKIVESSRPPKTADEAVHRVLDGLRNQKARAVWEFLPPAYRADLQQLVRDVAQQLDDRTWLATVAVWQKARKVLPAKSAAIFEQTVPDSSAPKISRPAINPKSLQRLFDSIGNSELTDLKRLQQIDVGQFLETTGGDVLQALGALPTGGAMSPEAFANLAKVEVKLISDAGDSAVVRMKWPDQEPTEHSYVRVDGYWLPRTLAESWSGSLAEIRVQALTWAEELRQQPDSWNARLQEIDHLLDDLAATKSADDARQVYQLGMQRLVATWQGAPHPDPEKAQPAPAIKKLNVPDTEELLPDEK